MREIKFRGKRLDNGEWIYGNLIQMDNGGSQVFIFSFYEGASSMSCRDLVAKFMVGIDHKTIGQYTGLKSKSGQEIYEGDIVTAQHLMRSAVHFERGCFYAEDTLLDQEYDGIYCGEELDVIGNIY